MAYPTWQEALIGLSKDTSGGEAPTWQQALQKIADDVAASNTTYVGPGESVQAAITAAEAKTGYDAAATASAATLPFDNTNKVVGDQAVVTVTDMLGRKLVGIYEYQTTVGALTGSYGWLDVSTGSIVHPIHGGLITIAYAAATWTFTAVAGVGISSITVTKPAGWTTSTATSTNVHALAVAQVVKLAPGIYSLSTAIIVKPYVTLEGAGDLTVLNWTGADAKRVVDMQSHSALSRCCIRNRGTATGYGVWIVANARDITVEGNLFDVTSISVAFDNGSTDDVRVLRNRLSGWYCIETQNALLRNCDFSYNESATVGQSGVSAISGFLDAACDTEGSCYRNRISHNDITIRSTDQGGQAVPIYLPGWGHTITHNTFRIVDEGIGGAYISLEGIVMVNGANIVKPAWMRYFEPTIISHNKFYVDVLSGLTTVTTIIGVDLGGSGRCGDLQLSHNSWYFSAPASTYTLTALSAVTGDGTNKALIKVLEGGLSGLESGAITLTNATLIGARVGSGANLLGPTMDTAFCVGANAAAGVANRKLLAHWFRGKYTNTGDSNKVYTVYTDGTSWFTNLDTVAVEA